MSIEIKKFVVYDGQNERPVLATRWHTDDGDLIFQTVDYPSSPMARPRVENNLAFARGKWEWVREDFSA